MKAKFKKKMSIQMKAQLRKSLKQNQNESVKEFCDRCKEAEQLICDQQIQDTGELSVSRIFLKFQFHEFFFKYCSL